MRDAPAPGSPHNTCEGFNAPGTSVEITATATKGWTFLRWDSSACPAPTEPVCRVTFLRADVRAVAVFAPGPRRLVVHPVPNGSGSVVNITQRVGSIQCPNNCEGTLPDGSTVALSATLSSGYSIVSWSVPGCGAPGRGPATSGASPWKRLGT